MLVKDIMTTAVHTALPTADAEDILQIMKRENTDTVAICDIQKHLVGIITERDIITRFEPGKKAGAIMTPEPEYAAPRDNVHDAALKMSNKKVRRLPVVENDKLIGILTLRDFAKKRIFISEIGYIIYNSYRSQSL